MLRRPRAVAPLALLLALLAGCASDPEDQSTESSEARPATLPNAVFTEVFGRLHAVFYDDFEHPRRSKARYVLEEIRPGAPELSGELFELDFPGRPPPFMEDGATVRLRGTRRAARLAVAEGSTDPDASGSTQVVQAAATAVTGTQNTVVLIGDLSDQSVPCSASSIQDLVFGQNGSIDAYYQEISEGQLDFTGDVFGPFLLSGFDSSTCEPNGWAAALESAAAAAGVTLSAYDRVLYVLPQAGCAFAGLGTVGGLPSRSWILTCQLPDVYAHELGHNLTMQHASTQSSEYGDYSCIMGIGGIGLRQPNGPHQAQMGWISGVQDVTASGAQAVASIEGTGAPQVLRFPRGSGDDLYVSYRVPLGFDATELPNAYRNRVSVHAWPGGSTNTTLLAVLDVGQSFADPTSGVTIVHDASDGAVATVSFQSGCTPSAPTISITPAQQGGAAGDGATYSVTVQNEDSFGCPDRTLDLEVVVPSGWSGSAVPAQLTLAPQSSGSAQVDVVSDPAATGGVHPIQVRALESGAEVAATTASFVIDDSPPTAPGNLTASAGKKEITLMWQASTDDVAVAGYRVFRDGAEIASTTSTNFGDRSFQTGATYTYEVVAFDGSGITSPPSNAVTVTASSGRGKGNGGGGGNGKGNGKGPNK